MKYLGQLKIIYLIIWNDLSLCLALQAFGTKEEMLNSAQILRLTSLPKLVAWNPWAPRVSLRSHSARSTQPHCPRQQTIEVLVSVCLFGSGNVIYRRPLGAISSWPLLSYIIMRHPWHIKHYQDLFKT